MAGPQSWLASWVPRGQQRFPASFSNLQLLRGWNKNSRVAQWFDSLSNRAPPSDSDASTGPAIRYSDLQKAAAGPDSNSDPQAVASRVAENDSKSALVPASSSGAEHVAINQGALEFFVEYVRAMREFCELLALSAALPAFADGFFERVSDADPRIPSESARAHPSGSKRSVEREGSNVSAMSSSADSFVSATSAPGSPLHEPLVVFRVGAPGPVSSDAATASGATHASSSYSYASHESLFVRPDLLRDARFTALLSHALRLDMGALQGKCLGFQVQFSSAQFRL